MIDNPQQDTASFCLRPIPPVALAACALIAVTMLLAAPASAGPAPKVEVCHIPPGNPDNFHTITISENALAAHLAHGDIAEPCNAICDELCSDNNACTIDHWGNCDENGCLPLDQRPSVDCNDDEECTVDGCDPILGKCVYVADVGRSCGDGVVCTFHCNEDSECEADDTECCENDAGCEATYCNGNYCGVDNKCDSTGDPCIDDIDCTVDMCFDDIGCQNEPMDELCDDEVDCTVDSCDPVMGCESTPDDSLCDDGIACTINESCDPVTGCESTPDDSLCDDSNPCTQDGCDSATGCQHTQVVCDQGDFCNRPIGCFPDQGGCVYDYDPIRCDDNNPCTADSCDPVTGCAHEPILGCCRSNAECNTCDAGICNPTTNTCDPYPVCPPGEECNDDGSVPTCQPICVTAFDYQGTGDIAGFLSDCQQGCPDPTICYESPTVTSCVYDGDFAACEEVNNIGLSYGCRICPEPPTSDATCPCWDGSANSVPGVSNVVELWELYGPTTCPTDTCNDTDLTGSGSIKRTRAQCDTLTGQGRLSSEVRYDPAVGGAFCLVEGFGQSQSIYSFVPLLRSSPQMPSPEEEACFAEHDALITLGGTFPNYFTNSCGLASF